MVYYYTSGNTKMLRNIFIDYDTTNELSPCEYIKMYIEKCPDITENTKIAWIVETFLGIEKHAKFLKEIAYHLSEELSEEDQDYFMIIYYAVTFQIGPQDKQNIYKCLFNLSKPLLRTLTKFLGNNETIAFILQVAQTTYDTDYITDKIIKPLFEWQPYISEMGHTYAECVKNIKNKNHKSPTKPIQPNVLNRKGKELPTPQHLVTIPGTPPNSLQNKSHRMLTKSIIDQRLERIHEKNKHRASNLLESVKNANNHYAQVKSDKQQKISGTKLGSDTDFVTLPRIKHKFTIKNPSLPVKETNATLKRMHKRVQATEEEEIEWLHNLIQCNNSLNAEELLEFDRKETERERLLDIERKHLLGQITHEEAHIAKLKFLEENKRKYEQFLKEKAIWNEEIEKWKEMELEKNRKQIEKLSLIELNVIQAKSEVIVKNKENADKIKRESEMIVAKIMKQKQKDLERRINMIKEIKILAMIAKTTKLPKIIDMTETSGLGLLCEMSMAELQERLSIIKIDFKEELEKKRNLIKDNKITAQKELDEARNSIKNYMTEQAELRKRNKATKLNVEYIPSKEITDLKKILEEKRKQRTNFNN